MKWLINFIKRFFTKNKVKLLENSNINNENNNIKIQKDERDFSLELKRMVHPYMNDGNGFGIIKDLKSEDLV